MWILGKVLRDDRQVPQTPQNVTGALNGSLHVRCERPWTAQIRVVTCDMPGNGSGWIGNRRARPPLLIRSDNLAQLPPDVILALNREVFQNGVLIEG